MVIWRGFGACLLAVVWAILAWTGSARGQSPAASRIEQAQAARAGGQLQQATKLLQEAVAEAERAGTPDEQVAALTLYAELLRDQGKAADAGRCLERIFALRVRHGGVEHPQTLQAYRNVRDFYSGSGMLQL